MKKTIISSLAIVSSMGVTSAATWVADTTFTHATATDTISATIEGSAVTLTSDVAGAFKTGGTNTELTRIDENQVGPLVNYSFNSTAGIYDLTILVHNVVNTVGGGASNAIGNFSITYADGTVVTDALSSIGSVANIGSASDFTISGGIDGEPDGIANAFDDSQLLLTSSDIADYDPNGLGATAGTYLFSATEGNPQGSGLISFGNSSAYGGITDVTFSWVGNSTGGNTAFLGFSGTTVPEPSSSALLGLGGLALVARRRR